ncbi:MAG: hypothetical protein IPG38_12435 [Chitinophagaceae bacterium]|nr:hypothetical protein [Chitinophagaceae bacterium]
MPSIASERMLFIVRNNAGKIYLSDQPGNIFLIDKSKPVLWRKSSTNSSINPYIRNYYLLGVSDLFFNKNAGLLTAPSFATGFNKIIGISDTSCLIQNNTTLLYYSISLKEPVALPFEKANIYSIFKINDRYFVSTGNGGTFLLNVADMTLSPVEVFEKDGGLFNLKTSNSLLFWQTGMSNPVFIDGEKHGFNLFRW